MLQVFNLGNLNVNFVKVVIKSLNYYVIIILGKNKFLSDFKKDIYHKSITFKKKQMCYISKKHLITQYEKYNIYKLKLIYRMN